MKRVFAFLLIFCCVALPFSGCNDDKGEENGDINNNSQISTTVAEPSKEAVTLEQYKDKLDDVADFVFTTEMNTTKQDLSLFPYEGLLSCGLTSESGVNVATFYEFDSVDSANFIINDTIANNTSGYEEEKGKNFHKLMQDYVVIERVDKTVLITSTQDKAMTNAILQAIDY